MMAAPRRGELEHIPPARRARCVNTGPDANEVESSAAAAGAAAAFADVAGSRWTHLRAAGHAERAVDGAAGDLLQELG